MLNRLGRLFLDAYGGLPRSIWLLSFVLLVNRSGTMVLPFVVLFLKGEKDYSATEAGTLLSVYGVGAIVGALLGGWSAARFGPIRTQIVSLTASAPMFVLLAYVEGWVGLAITLFVLSVISESVRPASATATGDFAPPNLQKKAFALNRLAANLGMTVGPAVGGFVYLVHYRYLFYIDAATCLIAAALVLSFFGFQKKEKIAEHISRATIAVSKPWRDRHFLLFMGLMICVAVIFFQIMSTYPLYLKEEYRFIESQIGVLLAINTLVIVAFEMVLIHLLRRVQDLKVVAWGTVFVCVGFGITPFGTGAMFCVFGILLWTIGEMLTMPMSLAYVSRRTNRANRGHYLGMYTMCYSIAAVLAPLIGTALYNIDPKMPWYASLAATVPILAGFLWLARSESDELDEEASPFGIEVNPPMPAYECADYKLRDREPAQA